MASKTYDELMAFLDTTQLGLGTLVDAPVVWHRDTRGTHHQHDTCRRQQLPTSRVRHDVRTVPGPVCSACFNIGDLPLWIHIASAESITADLATVTGQLDEVGLGSDLDDLALVGTAAMNLAIIARGARVADLDASEPLGALHRRVAAMRAAFAGNVDLLLRHATAKKFPQFPELMEPMRKLVGVARTADIHQRFTTVHAKHLWAGTDPSHELTLEGQKWLDLDNASRLAAVWCQVATMALDDVAADPDELVVHGPRRLPATVMARPSADAAAWWWYTGVAGPTIGVMPNNIVCDLARDASWGPEVLGNREATDGDVVMEAAAGLLRAGTPAADALDMARLVYDPAAA